MQCAVYECALATSGTRRGARWTHSFNVYDDTIMSCLCRCPPPERIVINYAVRGLIGLLSSSGRPLSSHHSRREGGGGAAASASRHSISRSGSRALQTAFGQAAGSTSSLSALAGGASPAPNSAGQQNGNSEQPQQQQGSAVTATRQGSAQQGSTGASLLGRAASSASASSFDAVAASAAAAGTSGLPGVAEGSSTHGANSGNGTSYRGGERC